MKKLILASIFGFAVAASVQANTYSDNNPANVYLNLFNPSYTGEFTLAGYNPATETITSASALFTFWDGWGSESFSINMGGDIFTHGSFNSYQQIGGDVVNAWGILDSTGALSYTVSRTSGGLSEFWLKNANLTVETTARNVPDSGITALLLAVGVAGLLGIKRRLLPVA